MAEVTRPKMSSFRSGGFMKEREEEDDRARKSWQKGDYYNVCLGVYMTHVRQFYIENK